MASGEWSSTSLVNMYQDKGITQSLTVCHMQSTQEGHILERQIHGDTIIGELLLLAGPYVVGGQKPKEKQKNPQNT